MSRLQSGDSRVTIAEDAIRCIAEYAERAFPEEACGVLLGREGMLTTIVAAWDLPNQSLRQRARHFEITPEALYARTVRARELQLDVVGFFHSHPEGEAFPSPCDVRNGSGWPGYVNAIYACEPGNGRQQLRFYRTQPKCWREIQMRGVTP